MNLWLRDLPDGNTEQGGRVGEMNHKIISISALQLFLLNYACSWLYFKPCQCAVHTRTKGICHSMCQAFNILTHLPANHQQQPKRSSQACGHLPFISTVRTWLLPLHFSHVETSRAVCSKHQVDLLFSTKLLYELLIHHQTKLPYFWKHSHTNVSWQLKTSWISDKNNHSCVYIN